MRLVKWNAVLFSLTQGHFLCVIAENNDDVKKQISESHMSDHIKQVNSKEEKDFMMGSDGPSIQDLPEIKMSDSEAYYDKTPSNLPNKETNFSFEAPYAVSSSSTENVAHNPVTYSSSTLTAESIIANEDHLIDEKAYSTVGSTTESIELNTSMLNESIPVTTQQRGSSVYTSEAIMASNEVVNGNNVKENQQYNSRNYDYVQEENKVNVNSAEGNNINRENSIPENVPDEKNNHNSPSGHTDLKPNDYKSMDLNNPSFDNTNTNQMNSFNNYTADAEHQNVNVNNTREYKPYNTDAYRQGYYPEQYRTGGQREPTRERYGYNSHPKEPTNYPNGYYNKANDVRNDYHRRYNMSDEYQYQQHPDQAAQQYSAPNDNDQASNKNSKLNIRTFGRGSPNREAENSNQSADDSSALNDVKSSVSIVNNDDYYIDSDGFGERIARDFGEDQPAFYSRIISSLVSMMALPGGSVSKLVPSSYITSELSYPEKFIANLLFGLDFSRVINVLSYFSSLFMKRSITDQLLPNSIVNFLNSMFRMIETIIIIMTVRWLFYRFKLASISNLVQKKKQLKPPKPVTDSYPHKSPTVDPLHSRGYSSVNRTANASQGGGFNDFSLKPMVDKLLVDSSNTAATLNKIVFELSQLNQTMACVLDEQHALRNMYKQSSGPTAESSADLFEISEQLKFLTLLDTMNFLRRNIYNYLTTHALSKQLEVNNLMLRKLGFDAFSDDTINIITALQQFTQNNDQIRSFDVSTTIIETHNMVEEKLIQSIPKFISGNLTFLDSGKVTNSDRVARPSLNSVTEASGNVCNDGVANYNMMKQPSNGNDRSDYMNGAPVKPYTSRSRDDSKQYMSEIPRYAVSMDYRPPSNYPDTSNHDNHKKVPGPLSAVDFSNPDEINSNNSEGARGIQNVPFVSSNYANTMNSSGLVGTCNKPIVEVSMMMDNQFIDMDTSMGKMSAVTRSDYKVSSGNYGYDNIVSPDPYDLDLYHRPMMDGTRQSDPMPSQIHHSSSKRNGSVINMADNSIPGSLSSVNSVENNYAMI